LQFDCSAPDWGKALHHPICNRETIIKEDNKTIKPLPEVSMVETSMEMLSNMEVNNTVDNNLLMEVNSHLKGATLMGSNSMAELQREMQEDMVLHLHLTLNRADMQEVLLNPQLVGIKAVPLHLQVMRMSTKRVSWPSGTST
jgi:UDP-N-acetylglucosamine enolpyruvyl transferase